MKERARERTNEWLSTNVRVLGCSEPQCVGFSVLYPIAVLTNLSLWDMYLVLICLYMISDDSQWDFLLSFFFLHAVQLPLTFRKKRTNWVCFLKKITLKLVFVLCLFSNFIIFVYFHIYVPGFYP